MSEYSEDELVPPEWLNSIEFFQRILTKIDENAIDGKVTDLTIRPASKRGDHYASIMFRATIKYEYSGMDATRSSSKTVIIKTLPSADTLKGQNLSKTQLFENELNVYNIVIPAFEAVWRHYGENIKFAGRLLYGTLEPPQPLMILEDLCLVGYDVLRGRVFNLNEVKACLMKLAKWHAVSYKMATELCNSRSPQVTGAAEEQNAAPVKHLNSCSLRTTCDQLKRMQYSVYRADSLIRTQYMSGGMGNMIRALEEAGGFDIYLPKLRALEPHLIERCIAMNDAFHIGVSNSIYVLNHGDYHAKNLMIRLSEDGHLEDILFIDFQMTFFGPLIYDIQYACFTLFSREIRDNHRDQLMNFYFEQFIECLRKLQCVGSLPTYEQFQADHKRWCCIELFLVASNLPLTKLSDSSENYIDINMVFDSEDYRMKLYRNPDYIAYLRDLLPYYLKKGYLD